MLKHCHHCDTSLPVEDAIYCNHCGAKQSTELVSPYDKTYGSWTVTTEGDVEGRTITHLGTHEGHIDEIAAALASACYYSLRFSPASKVNLNPPDKPKTVSISLDIGSKTWDMSPVQRRDAVAKLLKDRPVDVQLGQYYASVVLKFR